MSMTITSQLLEAYVKCRTKCWLRYVGENPTGNAYSEWVQATNEAYRAEGVKRLVAEAPDGGRVATSPTDNLKTATWRMAADIPTRAPNLETRISIVERVFLCVRGGIDADLRQQRQRRVRAGIDHDVAQRGGQQAGRWQCESAERHVVHGPQQHDALDEVARRHQPRIGSGGGWPRIEVAGVRRNDGFGHRFGARSGSGCAMGGRSFIIRLFLGAPPAPTTADPRIAAVGSSSLH